MGTVDSSALGGFNRHQGVVKKTEEIVGAKNRWFMVVVDVSLQIGSMPSGSLTKFRVWIWGD